MAGLPETVIPTFEELRCRFLDRYVDLQRHGWRVRMRHRFGYHKPDEYYEATVDRLISEQDSWLDVGGGKTMLPDFLELALWRFLRCLGFHYLETNLLGVYQKT